MPGVTAIALHTDPAVQRLEPGFIQKHHQWLALGDEFI
jgi:hypothetical protein